MLLDFLSGTSLPLMTFRKNITSQFHNTGFPIPRDHQGICALLLSLFMQANNLIQLKCTTIYPLARIAQLMMHPRCTMEFVGDQCCCSNMGNLGSLTYMHQGHEMTYSPILGDPGTYSVHHMTFEEIKP